MSFSMQSMPSICISAKFSTTRKLVKKTAATTRPNGANKIQGGLRTEGYYKKSYKNKPLVTIVTVVYNAAQCLETCIQSVIGQDYDNIEYLIIDGGSKDGTLEIIKKHTGVIDYWLSEKDTGIYDAMNKGVDLASGDWIYFLGSDDVLLNHIKQIAASLKNRRTIYYGNVFLFPILNQVYAYKFDACKLMNQNISHQAIFYPRGAFDQHKFDLKYKLFADYVFNIQRWAQRRFKFRYLPILVARYNETGLSGTYRDLIFEQDKADLMRPLLAEAYFLRGARRVKRLILRVCQRAKGVLLRS